MDTIVAVYGSPRRRGNTATLLKRAVEGAREAGADVTEVFLRDFKMSPCLELYGCKKTGRCVIQDDFQDLMDMLLASRGLMLASPIFFYSVSAHTKILMDRCQALWAKKYLIDKKSFGMGPITRKGLFLAAGATKGKKLFEGTLLSVRYFFDVLDMELWGTVLVRGVDCEGDILQYPERLEEAYTAGRDLALALRMTEEPSVR